MPVEPSGPSALNVAIAKEVVTALQQAVCAVHGVLTSIGPLREHAIAQRWRRCRIQRETGTAPGDVRRERLVYSDPVALCELVSAAVEDRLRQQPANVAPVPSRCTCACARTFDDA